MAIPRRARDSTTAAVGRNLGLGLVLLAFVVIVFGLTVVKVERSMQAIRPRRRPLAEAAGVSGDRDARPDGKTSTR